MSQYAMQKSAKPTRRSRHPYELVRRAGREEFHGNLKVREILVGGVRIGGPRPVVIAGPCSVESLEQTVDVARACRDAGADMLRGGAYKPRTSPYDFQGLGIEGLEILAEARAQTGLPIVTEVIDPRLVEEVCRFADVLQIGARSMQNFPLLVEAGKSGKPVLLKRHWGATLQEWLCAAEYVAAQGNLNVILCERGIRTFSQGTYNRNTLDLNVVDAARRETFLPIFVDPSHGTGVADLVPAASLAGVACGAHGLMIEVIGETADPAEAMSDGYQAIRPSMLRDVIERARCCATAAAQEFIR
ncbi:MAG: 3-deoxy-7-phosphoheptulonate synthase [Planctomycetes bacterium]|nr:3-deoxy-7-phosphoheptulonate synthase [Planctomycetota bacterium]